MNDMTQVLLLQLCLWRGGEVWNMNHETQIDAVMYVIYVLYRCVSKPFPHEESAKFYKCTIQTTT